MKWRIITEITHEMKDYYLKFLIRKKILKKLQNWVCLIKYLEYRFL